MPGWVANATFWLHVIEGMLFAFGHYGLALSSLSLKP
jgi:hypothetical protein